MAIQATCNDDDKTNKQIKRRKMNRYIQTKIRNGQIKGKINRKIQTKRIETNKRKNE